MGRRKRRQRSLARGPRRPTELEKQQIISDAWASYTTLSARGGEKPLALHVWALHRYVKLSEAKPEPGTRAWRQLVAFDELTAPWRDLARRRVEEAHQAPAGAGKLPLEALALPEGFEGTAAEIQQLNAIGARVAAVARERYGAGADGKLPSLTMRESTGGL